MAEAEEVAQRAQHAGEVGVVLGDLEQALAVVVALGHPDVGDLRRAGDVGQDGHSLRAG